MIRRMLMTVVCLAALAVAVPAAADPTDPAETAPSISPSIATSSGPTSESPVSPPAQPTQSSVEPTAPSVSPSSSAPSPVSPTSASSPSDSTGSSVAPKSQGTVADGPSVMSAGGPIAVYVTVVCNGHLHITVDNPAPGTAYVYRLVAQPGTDPVDLAGEIEITPFGPLAYVDEPPIGTYTAEVTGTDDSSTSSAPFAISEPCIDPPVIYIRAQHVPCGPGDDMTGLTGYIRNPKDDEVYMWLVISEVPDDGIPMDPVTGQVAPDGTFTLTGLKPGTFSVILSGDEGSLFEGDSFAIYACPKPTSPPATLPPSSAEPSDSPSPSTTSSSPPPQPIGSVDATAGVTGGLAATGTGPGSLALLGAGVVALLAGSGVLRGRVRNGRRG